jgi:hypothetical protein
MRNNAVIAAVTRCATQNSIGLKRPKYQNVRIEGTLGIVVVVQFAKPQITKAAKVHEGNLPAH